MDGRETMHMQIARVNGTELAYRLDGAGDRGVVMLSNSLGADISMWEGQVSALTAARFRVLRYDGRGHGRSAVPTGPYTLEMLADDAVGLMDSLDLQTVHFCGLSLGGMVGQALGGRHGDRLASLTLSSTAAVMPPREVWDERMALVRKAGMASVADATMDRWFTRAGQARLAGEVSRIRRALLDTPVEGYCACCAAIRDMDLSGSLNGISKPVLILVGEQDPGTPVSAARFIHERIASSRLKVIPDAAHFVNVEQVDAFNEALVGFIACLVPR
jgi:3-oxoadipate enol-lactonase